MRDRVTIFDGLRGVAAIAVVLLHGCSIFNLGWLPAHAYLAVDFFFLLSGYVIARAFDERLRQGWLFGFLQRRLIRLYPLIVVGSLVGFIEMIIHGVLTHSVSISQAALDLASSLLVLPTPPWISERWRLFPVDAPLWSLFFELAANVAYAVAAPALRTRYLWLLVALSGSALTGAIYVFNGGDFGLVRFQLATLRVAFSFFLGVALYRAAPCTSSISSWVLPIVATPLILAALAAVLLAPGPVGWGYDLLAVLVIFPALLLGALAANPGGRRLRAACTVLGTSSYPLYATHLPLLLLVYGACFDQSARSVRTIGFAASLAAVLLLSWLMAILFDQPLRRWVSSRVTHPRGIRRKIMRLFMERGFASRAIRLRAYGIMRNRLGMAAPMLTEDRRVLEQIIFAHYRNDSRIRNVLFVGCDSYTAHYQRRYFPQHNYWTIDPDASCRRFGAKQHVTGQLQDLKKYFSNEFFDLIILNGVYGWGLDSAEDCDTAVSQCLDCLAPGGHMLIGWNDVPGRDPAPLTAVRSLSRLAKFAFPGFNDWQYLTDTLNRHTYYFYTKTE